MDVRVCDRDQRQALPRHGRHRRSPDPGGQHNIIGRQLDPAFGADSAHPAVSGVDVGDGDAVAELRAGGLRASHQRCGDCAGTGSAVLGEQEARSAVRWIDQVRRSVDRLPCGE